MNLSDFKLFLAENASLNLRFLLPTGGRIPPHVHVTEVARIDKRFVDCGGTFRTEVLCRLQTWFSDDTDHRLTAGKLLGILNKAGAFLETDSLLVEVEYEAPFVSQFPLTGVVVEGQSLFIHLGIKHTACLAEDKCLPPKLNRPPAYHSLPSFGKASCGS